MKKYFDEKTKIYNCGQLFFDYYCNGNLKLNENNEFIWKENSIKECRRIYTLSKEKPEKLIEFFIINVIGKAFIYLNNKEKLKCWLNENQEYKVFNITIPSFSEMFIPFFESGIYYYNRNLENIRCCIAYNINYYSFIEKLGNDLIIFLEENNNYKSIIKKFNKEIPCDKNSINEFYVRNNFSKKIETIIEKFKKELNNCCIN